MKHQNLIVAGLLAKLDFDKIAKVMQCLEWSWNQSEDAPSHSQLKATAERLLTEMLEKGNTGIATGGFEVWHNGQEFGIRFVVESSATVDFD